MFGLLNHSFSAQNISRWSWLWTHCENKLEYPNRSGLCKSIAREMMGHSNTVQTYFLSYDFKCVIFNVQYWFHKMGQIFHQWLACVNAGQPVISPGASPARQAQNWLRPAHEMGSSPHTVRARKIYPPKSYLGLHPVYCVAASMDAVNHVSSRRAGQDRSGQDSARSAWPHSASSKQLWVDLNVQ